MTFKRIFGWITGLPIAAAGIVFAVANRQWITVSLDPLNRAAPRIAIDMPLWVLYFLGIFTGILAGWVAAWFAHGKWRRAARDARIELLRTQNEHEKLKREHAARAIAKTEDAGA